MFSKACEYAIRSSIYIASQSILGHRVNLQEVAKKIESPEAFTSKILQKLVKDKIIKSVKGPGGGFEVEINQMAKIKLIRIVQAIDGDVLNRCSLGLDECSDHQPCPFHNKYKPIKNKLLDVFGKTSLHDLIKGLKNGETYLKL